MLERVGLFDSHYDFLCLRVVQADLSDILCQNLKSIPPGCLNRGVNAISQCSVIQTGGDIIRGIDVANIDVNYHSNKNILWSLAFPWMDTDYCFDTQFIDDDLVHNSIHQDRFNRRK